jgi:Ca2+-binding RTX toxin-like protein
MARDRDLQNVENLTGTSHADYLQGDAAPNRLEGGAGHDVLVNSPGADRLAGGADADRFEYHTIDATPDTISDFTIGVGGDVLDVSRVLIGYHSGASSLGDFVKLQSIGSNTAVLIDADGLGADFVSIATLSGVSGALLNDLLAQGNLVPA